MGKGIIVFNNGAKNDLKIKKNMYVMHNHTEYHSDGSSDSIERTMETSDEKIMLGDQWLNNPNRLENVDKASDCFRQDKEFMLMKEKRIHDDGKGNKTVDEKAVKKEDVFSTRGNKLIGNSPALLNDKRGKLLSDFSSGNSNPFKIGSGKTSPELPSPSDDPFEIDEDVESRIDEILRKRG